MLAVMMGNAGGAWDNAKKLCEKLKLKKTEVGKACVVGDTVGDPFKDTSGPSLDILLKLMSMIALLIAPLIQGNQDWENAWVGAIPLTICIIVTIVLNRVGILTWADPLAAAELPTDTSAKANEVTEADLRKGADVNDKTSNPPSVCTATTSPNSSQKVAWGDQTLH